MTEDPQQDLPLSDPLPPEEHANDTTSVKSSGNPAKKQKLLLVKYGKMGQIGLFYNNIKEFPSDTSHVIVSTERGLELGEILMPQSVHKEGQCRIKIEKVDQFCAASDNNYPLHRDGKVVRIATDLDKNEQRHLDMNIRHIIDQCRSFIDQDNLEMKLVDAEHLFGGDRIIFYFMAEGRVDFRQLVKQLAQHFQTRIEMRQIGARDEARLVADFETCGRECCCKNFLKVLKPVNMRMAKLQKATLDPSKISGRCGRLKCCLRYEDEVYNELYKKLPHKGECVLVEDGHGEVIDCQTITQLVRIRLANGKQVAVHVEDILKFNYTPTPEDLNRLEKPSGKRRQDRPRQARPAEPPAPKLEKPPVDADLESMDDLFDLEGLENAPSGSAEQDQEPRDNNTARKRRRKKKKRRPASGEPSAQATDRSEPKPQTSDSDNDKNPAPSKRKRRPRNRRRGRGRPDSNNQGNGDDNRPNPQTPSE